MNWGGMPIGFRFYVEDYSRETKERCWAHVLRALEYADLTEVSLHEGETEEAFLSRQKVYIPVVGAKSIKISRKNAMLWREDPALMGQLALYRPLIQENYMELFAPTRRLADVTMSGEIRPEAPGEGLFPKAIRRREPIKKTGRLLVWGETAASVAARMETLAREEPTLGGRRVVLQKGPDAVQYATAFRRGQLFSQTLSDGIDGEAKCIFGILPGGVLLCDSTACPGNHLPFSGEYGIGQLLYMAQSWGITKAILLTGGSGFDKSVVPHMELTLDPPLMELYDMRRALRSCIGVYLKMETDLFAELEK